MCGGRKTQGREMRRQWEKSARFFVGFFFVFYYCWVFCSFFLLLLSFFFFWKVPGKGSDCLEQILMAPGPSLGR